MEAVRCPECGKKYGEHLEGGLLIIFCRECQKHQVIDRREAAVLK